MKQKQMRFIYWAFVLSVCAHFSIAPFVQHMKFEDASRDVPGTVILESPHPKLTPPPSPPPTPKPTSRPQQRQQARPARQAHVVLRQNPNPRGTNEPDNNMPNVSAGESPGPGSTNNPGDALASASAAPTPSPTPKPVCAVPFADASTIEKYVPEMPRIAADQGLTGSVQVKVQLTAKGTVEDASVFVSSGSTILDTAAVDAAKRTTYAPKTVDCEHVPGSYLFKVNFENN